MTLDARIENIEKHLKNAEIYQKEVLTMEEAAHLIGVKRTSMYNLTAAKKIPHYKPMGKMIYFNRSELESWMQQNRIATDEELSREAKSRCLRK